MYGRRTNKTVLQQAETVITKKILAWPEQGRLTSRPTNRKTGIYSSAQLEKLTFFPASCTGHAGV